MALGLDAGILLMATIIAVIAFVAVVNSWLIPSTQAWFIDAMISMPKFDYDNDGNDNYQTYIRLRDIAFIIIAIALVFSAFILFGEEFYIFRKHQAFSIISNGVIFIILLLVFPSLWDMFASFIEQISYYILNPEDPDDINAINNKVEFIFQQIGSPNIDWDTILQFLTNPNDAAQTIFRDVFLAVFKAFIAAITVFLMFVIGTVRIVLTAIMIIALPLLLAFSLIPFADRVMNRLKDILIGLSFAPILSSLVITAGIALLNSSSFDPLQYWMASIAIGLLAIMIPSITAPVVGSIVSQLTTIGSAAMLSGLYIGSQAVIGGIRGASLSINTAIQSGIPFTSLAMAKSAISGLGRGAMYGSATGIIHSASEALSATGFNKLSYPIQRAEYRLNRSIDRVANVSANRYIQEASGSLTEGLLSYLSLQDRDDIDTSKGIAFANTIKQLADNNEYARIADIANDYLKFNNIPNKEEFGKAFANQIEAYSKNAIAISKLYHNLNDIKNRGGVLSLDTNTISNLIHARDYYRELSSNKYGIIIPNPNFEASDLIKRSEYINPNVTNAYPIKFSIASLMQEAISIPRSEIPVKVREEGLKVISDSEGVIDLQKSISQSIKGIWGSMNIRYDSREINKLSLEFAKEIAKYDPETIGIIINGDSSFIATNHDLNHLIKYIISIIIPKL
ncbi:MAG: hypothetical protein KatS3mg003_1462 [Candidatus Nitrosocaldaceae archaeon]|nr:MAG: hypothetical protein KatS3mg003_1462 [Candidatus Nitrosocaldaceae archaeon]